MAQYGLDQNAACGCPRYNGQPYINAQNAFVNSNQLHINFVPYQTQSGPQMPDAPQDARGLEGADVFGPAPGCRCP